MCSCAEHSTYFLADLVAPGCLLLCGKAIAYSRLTVPRGASRTSVLLPHTVNGGLTPGKAKAADMDEEHIEKESAVAFHLECTHFY